MTRGKVTFVAIPGPSADAIPWQATNAVAEADFIWAGPQAPADLLRHAAPHADIIITTEDPPTHSVLPFYDLASGGGFRITQIYTRAIPLDEVLEQTGRCCELGLEFEFVLCP